MCLSSVVVSSSPRQYHFVNQEKSWTEAQSYCREKHTDLVTINDIQEQNDIKQLLNSNSDHVWIGLRSTNTWIWSLSDSDIYTRGDLLYEKWDKNTAQPQPQEDGDCVFMDCGSGANCAKGQKGYWHDANCSYTMHFICYNGEFNCK